MLELTTHKISRGAICTDKKTQKLTSSKLLPRLKDSLVALQVRAILQVEAIKGKARPHTSS